MNKIWVFVFSIFWIAVILLDYNNKSTIINLAFAHFKFTPLLLGVISIAGITGFLSSPKSKFAFGKKWNGLTIGILMIVFFILILTSNFQFANITFSMSGLFSALGKTLGGFLAIVFIWMSSMIAGQFINTKLSFQLKKFNSITIDLVIGLIFHITLLFVLGLLGLLRSFIIIPLLLLPYFLNYKYAFVLIKKLTVQPIFERGKEHWMVPVLFIILTFFLCINFVSNIAPFPVGFDSRNYYMNISKLLSESGSLIRGFQPYPWQLFLAQGFIVFKSASVTLLLSFTAGIMAMIGVYELCRQYFNISSVNSLLIILAFAVTPAMANHMFVELKIDFGLLLFQIAAILLLADILHKNKSIQIEKINVKSILKPVIFFGLIIGFGASIKLLNLYLLFSVLLILWGIYFKFRGYLAIFLLMMAVVLIAQFDAVSGLSQYHLSIHYVKYACLIIGVILFGSLLFVDRSKFVFMIKTSSIIVGLVILMLAPWLTKNYIETKSTNPSTILMGKSPGPSISIQKLLKNYEEKKKK